MANTPMVLHFYDEESNVEKTFTRSFVPWKMLKRAVALQSLAGKEKMTEEDIDSITGLMVAVFGGQFTIEEADEKADITEMMAVLNRIIAVASGGTNGNFQEPGK